jgi:hypothetical protein
VGDADGRSVRQQSLQRADAFFSLTDVAPHPRRNFSVNMDEVQKIPEGFDDVACSLRCSSASHDAPGA